MKEDSKKRLLQIGRFVRFRSIHIFGVLLKTMKRFSIECGRRWRRLKPATQKSILLAVTAHIVILVIAALVVAVPGRRSVPEIIASVVEIPDVPDVKRQRLSAVKQVRQASPSASSAMSKMMLANTKAAVNFPLSEIEVDSILPGNSPTNLGIGRNFDEGSGNDEEGGRNGIFPLEIRGRCVSGERKRLLEDNGGSAEVESAVEKSLQWLKEEQHRNGKWGQQHVGSMTGLALLCFLGRCETTTSEEYGRTVAKGIQALMTMARKNKDGYFSESDEPTVFAYEHGIATYALGEALILSRGSEIPGLRESFTEGVKIIMNSQTPDGGWVYGYFGKTPGDLSVTGWQVQALKAAKIAKIFPDDLESTISKAAQFIEDRQGPQGGFGYRKIGDKPSLAGVGILALQFLGRPSSGRAIKAYDFWFDETPQFIYASPDCDLYASYYINQAIFNTGGSNWTKWNQQMLPELLRAQDPRGTYRLEGSEKSIDQSNEDAEIFRTTLCTLMLEVYYRYLPVGGK